MALDKVLYQEGAEDHRGKVLSAAAGGARGTSNQFNAGRANHIHFNCIQDARNIQSTSVLQGIFKSDSNAVFTNRFSSTLRHLNTRRRSKEATLPWRPISVRPASRLREATLPQLATLESVVFSPEEPLPQPDLLRKPFEECGRVHRHPRRLNRIRSDVLVSSSALFRAHTTEEGAQRPVHSRDSSTRNGATGRTNRTGVNLSSTNAASSIGPRPTPPANAVRPRTPGELIYDGPGHLLKEHKAGVQERRRSEDEARGHSFPLGGIAALDFHSRYGSPRFDFEAVMSVYGHRVNSEPETSSRGRGKRKRKGRTPQKNSRTLPGPRFPIK